MAESQQTRIEVGVLNVSARAKELVMQALDNNRLSYGPLMQRLENQFSRLHGCHFGIMTNSGTSALHISLAALKEIHGWGDGDEVIVPAVTFIATSNIVIHNRMHPVFVDVDPVYYELDPRLLESKINSRTRAILPVHLFGQPCDMAPIREIADRYDLKIIEDSCETMFAKYRGVSVGALGDIGCFSTYVAHLLVTGVGGICTTNDPDYAMKVRSIMNHGRDSIYISIDDDDNKSDDELRMIIARRFSFVSLGHSFRVTELEAALGLAGLEDWESMITKRRANAMYLTKVLARWEDRLQLPAIRQGNDHSFMMYPIVLRDEPKIELVNHLEINGVETRDLLPIINQPIYRRLFSLDEDRYPVTQWMNSNGFYVGCHQGLDIPQLDRICELIGDYLCRR